MVVNWEATRHRFRPNLPRDAFLFLGLVIGLAQGLGISPTIDSLIYWRAHLDALYPVVWWQDLSVGYVYPPPFAQLLAPVHLVGYGIYQTAVTTLLFGCLWYCAGPWSWAFVAFGALRAFIPALPAECSVVLGYAMNGNVQLLLAAAIVAGFRHPSLWAMPLLTKSTMGVGLLWFAFRREWWPFLVALGMTAAIVGVSLLLAPGLWTEWIVFTIRNADAVSPIPLVPVPLPIRFAMSVGLLLWAAPRGHRWAVPIAAGWAIPVLYVGSYLAIWVGAIRLLDWREVGEPRLRVGGVVEPRVVELPSP